ncbi:DUF190 domain-containing protein [Myxacorys almedinensis A]|uniref:DUF190 domain-containing protein n=2 Tax=Myxacorys TaxID=2056239 RepID=A0A8J7Z1J2_9CYAN|nr:DUF190 domain-containing protein [Myxacorys almedinensis A]
MSRWQQLTIYIGETDQWKHQPLYSAIVTLAREHGLAGATVTRGMAGFGEKGKIRTANILALSIDVPIVITIIDREDVLTEFIPAIRAMVHSGLITLQPMTVLKSNVLN